MEVVNEHFRSAGASERLLAATGVGVGVAGAAAVWYFDPVNAGFFPQCPLYSMTGFACPGCGLTRGFHALFNGDILTALDYNALLPLVAVFFGYIFFSLLMVSVRGRGFAVNRTSIGLVWGTLVLLLAFGVMRNIPVYPFTILFP